jgi:hypothetical protein
MSNQAKEIWDDQDQGTKGVVLGYFAPLLIIFFGILGEVLHSFNNGPTLIACQQ